MEQISLFDFVSKEEQKQYKPVKSNDWKWSMKNDYPQKNGIKVFSCFACGGGVDYGI